MWPVLEKLFVRSFYKANTGFFLFFFFLFVGAVQGGSLVSYHLSLMKSILGSSITLSLVLVCWLFYHVKCTGFFLRVINNREGEFLSSLQVLPRGRQWILCLCLYFVVYVPVLLYSVVLAGVGYTNGAVLTASVVLLFQLCSLVFFTTVVYYRLNHWLEKMAWPAWQLPLPKPFCLLVFFYFTRERKSLLLLLKLLSLALLSIVFIWNQGRYNNDAFLLFYLVLLLAHAALPYFAVQFLEKDFALARNLPLTLAQRAVAFLLAYSLLLLPEGLFILVKADAFSVAQRLAYGVNLLAGLWLLTAFLYSEAQRRDEYLKAGFALVFLSLFFLHVQAYWFWILVQAGIGILLFINGYHRFERVTEE